MLLCIHQQKQSNRKEKHQKTITKLTLTKNDEK